jgi:hypothetical protein
MPVGLDLVVRAASARGPERDQELRQQRRGVRLRVRLGSQHELARGAVQRRLGDRRRPIGHARRPLR